MRTSKKIYYFPGLISAIIIPILFWYYGNQKIEEARTSVMDIWLPPKLSKDKSNLTSTFEPLRNWNYKKIKVDPNKENSSFFVSEIKALQKRNKKNTGIEFILDKKNTYGDFASLLNDMAIARHETYYLDIEKTGHFFVPVIYKDPNAEEEEECLLCNDVIAIDAGSITIGEIPQDTLYEKVVDFCKILPKEGFMIIFGFLLFLNISMLSIKEKFQFQRSHYY